MMVFFKILWGFDAIVSLIVFYFFFLGLSDGTVSSRNGGLWFMIVGGLLAIMIGSIWLKNQQHPGIGILLLMILALPAFLYLAYIVIAMLGGGRWN